jgi:Phosphoinositide phospholipase C, Ca2+-dependent
VASAKLLWWSRPVLIALAWLPAAIAGATGLASDGLRINELQYIGTHNSYHAGLGAGEARVLKARAPEFFATLDYSHPTLTRQLNDGVRQIELDVYADARGGRYAHPVIEKWVAKAGLPADPPFADPAVMQTPGFKVMHIQDLDQRSTCQPLVACLLEVRRWSRAHPRHLPLFILLETKDAPLRAEFASVIPEPFDTRTLENLEAELESVISRQEYIDPDDVRGGYPTLNAAIRAGGWPTVEAARGKIIFLLDQRSVGPAYLRGHESLRGRLMFTNGSPGAPDAAFIERNDGPAEEITQLVKAGYLIRTRTDADLKEPRARDTTRRDALMASGAQILSTDFPRNEPASTGFAVSFPCGQMARDNPQLVRPFIPCRRSETRIRRDSGSSSPSCRWRRPPPSPPTTAAPLESRCLREGR